MKDYSAPELADLLKVHRGTIRRQCEAGKIKASLVKRGAKLEYAIPQDEVDRLLAEKEVKSNHVRYKPVYDQWIADMRNGTHTGKVLSPRTIDGYEYGLKKYWVMLALPEQIENLSPTNLRTVMGKIADQDEGEDHHASRDLVYRAVKSFYKHLVFNYQ